MDKNDKLFFFKKLSFYAKEHKIFVDIIQTEVKSCTNYVWTFVRFTYMYLSKKKIWIMKMVISRVSTVGTYFLKQFLQFCSFEIK